MRVAIVTESFLPQVNGMTNSVCRVLEYLAGQGHDALVVAPGAGPGFEDHAGQPIRLTPGVPLPFCRSFVVGLPTRQVTAVLRDFAPDVVHLAAPFTLGASGVNGLLYPPDDAGALRAAVRTPVTDPTLRDRLAGEARASVRGRDWSAIRAEPITHYDAVRSGAPERRAA